MVEPLRVGAAALELEEEAKAGTKQVVEVVHRERGERIRVEGCGGAAAQSCQQLLFEEPLCGLVEHAQLAWRSDQISELVQQPSANAVEGSDPGSVQHLRPQVGPPRRELGRNALAELFGG